MPGKIKKSDLLNEKAQGIEFSGEVVSDDQDGITIRVGNSIFEIKKDDVVSKKENQGVTRVAVKQDAQVIQSKSVVAGSVRRRASFGLFGGFTTLFGNDCTECSECSECTECSECSECTECSECLGFTDRFGHDLAGNARTFKSPVLTRRFSR
jgi:hypothetical protein